MITIDREKKILFAILFILFISIGSWQFFSAYRDSHNLFLTGSPPQDVMTAYLPKTIDPALVHAPAINPHEPMRFGGTTSVLSIIQFGDYECAGCKLFSQTAKNTLGEYNGNIRYIYRDMPLSALHPHAMEAALFARCAGLQGKFWEAHDALTEANTLDSNSLLFIARKLKLDIPLQQACQKDKEMKTVLEKDIEFAKSEGITSVPFIFVGTNGSIGAMTADELRSEIDAFANK